MRTRPRPLAWALLAVVAGPPLTAAPATALPPVRHVFVLVLENQSYESTFGTFGTDSPAPYLARVLPAQGALLQAVLRHRPCESAQLRGDGERPGAERADAARLSYLRGVRADARARPDAHGQLPGAGCVYPRAVNTLPDQLETAGFTWKAYMEDMGNNPAREPAACGHVPVGQPERTNVGTARRSVRRQARSVRLLPFDHRRSRALRGARGESHSPARGSRQRRHHCQLRVHHAEPLQRRSRPAVRRRPRRRAGGHRRAS